MSKGCANCEPIAKTSLITGLILVVLGAVDSFVESGLRLVPQVLLGASIASFVGVVAGFWGLISVHIQPLNAGDRMYIYLTLLNGALFVTAILVVLI
jgi:hypothetical protein